MGASGYGAVPVGDVDVYRHNVITGNDFTGATSGPFSEVKKEGVGFETHGDVAATIVFKSVGGSRSAAAAICVVGARGWPAKQDHPAYPASGLPRLVDRELRITSVSRALLAVAYHNRVAVWGGVCTFLRRAVVDQVVLA
jgi:hypothetical protein